MPEVINSMSFLTMLFLCLALASANPVIEAKELGLSDSNQELMDLSSPEARSTPCHNCGGHSTSSIIHPTIPHFPTVGPLDLALMGEGKLFALAIPIIIMQIVTMGLLLYFIRSEKDSNYDDSPSYYGGSSYNDGSYTRYRNLESDGNSITWVLDNINNAVDLYHQYLETDSAYQVNSTE